MTLLPRIKGIVLSFIIFYPLFSIFQGLDITDTGYSVANYALFFDHYSSIASSSGLWLTMFLGAVWEKTVGIHIGLLGHKLLFVFLTYLNVFISYQLLKNYFRPDGILIGLFLAVAYQYTSLNTFNYNMATSTFYLLAIYFLYFGLREEKPSYLFLSGLIIGFNIFIRLPNIIGVGLSFFILFDHFYLRRHSSKILLLKSFQFFSGVSIAIAIVLVCMYSFGHYDFFATIVKQLYETLFYGPGDNTHSGIGLTVRYVNDLKDAAESALHVLLFIAAYLSVSAFAAQKIRSEKLLRKFQLLLSGIFLTIGLYAFIQAEHEVIYYVFGLVFFLLLLLISHSVKNKNDTLLYLSVFALVYLCIGFLGSDTGIYNSKYTLYLAMALIVSYALSYTHNIQHKIFSLQLTLTYQQIRSITYMLLTILMIAAFVHQARHPYRDGPKFILLSPVDHPRLVGIHTSSHRAQSITEVLEQIRLHAKPGDTILSYDSTPLIYYATQTVPYLNRTWMETLSPQKVTQAFAEKEKATTFRPLVVRAKYDTNNGGWPETKFILPLDEWAQNRKIGDDFLSRNQYKKIWENDFFALYLPKEKNDRK